MEMNTISDDMFAPLPEEERNSEFIAMDSKTYLQDAWGRFKKNKLAPVWHICWEPISSAVTF